MVNQRTKKVEPVEKTKTKKKQEALRNPEVNPNEDDGFDEDVTG